jgi:gluconokinase
MSASGPPGTTTIIVMGVSGSGKSTVAATLVDRLGWEFAEGDDFHPPANVEKMRAGHPLDDDDRWPWLRRLAAWIGEHEKAGRNVVVTCSALKRSYRDLLREHAPSMLTVFARGDVDLIHARITARRHEYMPPSLLPTQLEDLEEREDDEPGLTVDIAQTPEQIVERVMTVISAGAAIHAS